MSVRNEIKAQIIRAGFTMQEVVDLLHDEYGWSDSVSNLSAKLQRESIPVLEHRAVQMTRKDYDNYDYLIGMDSANMRNLNRMLKNDPEEKLYKFLTFAGSGRDIADPWYTGNFDETYEDIQEGCEGFLDYLEKHGEIHY